MVIPFWMNTLMLIDEKVLVVTLKLTIWLGNGYTSTLKSWLGTSALAFTKQIATSPLYTTSDTHNDIGTPRRELAVANHVHRVWVVDQEGLLVGVVSLTDVIRVIRQSMLS
ncbi:AMP-activated kinase, gamma regulatory subunit, putative [Medicago truncatula]|uniref:AMP-activated kinase, gamma regulatory subunit, putative n=1 Tax=Medicago truncatula TaxID=3880 RepID=G7II73_MEDTR|nr:AMP-activated kinase, gamma regulatory subunit, putative [Medicago truncatula]